MLIDARAVLVELVLPSGPGFGVRRSAGGPFVVEDQALVVYQTPSDAGFADDAVPSERFDLVHAADRLTARRHPWTPELLDAVVLVHDLSAQLGLTGTHARTGPGSRLRTVAAERRLDERIAADENRQLFELPTQWLAGLPTIELAAVTAEWLDALAALDAALRWVPGPPTLPRVVSVSLEELVPEVEVLWLGAAERGGFTLMAGADPMSDLPARFLGRTGTVELYADVEALRAYLSDGAPRLPGVPSWHRLVDAGRVVDLTPYEDNVIDLDELGATLHRLTPTVADQLLRARLLIVDLADAVEAIDVLDRLADGPLARLFDRDLPVLAEDPRRAADRIAALDADLLGAEWAELVKALASRLSWR
ncbi:MAG TPA: hypothetical protein VLC50_06670 [Actinomycetes bacterium]|nr:hypothetical protein [Actinomycetes bacterium]